MRVERMYFLHCCWWPWCVFSHFSKSRLVVSFWLCLCQVRRYSVSVNMENHLATTAHCHIYAASVCCLFCFWNMVSLRNLRDRFLVYLGYWGERLTPVLDRMKRRSGSSSRIYLPLLPKNPVWSAVWNTNKILPLLTSWSSLSLI